MMTMMKVLMNILAVCVTAFLGASVANAQQLTSPKKNGVSIGNVKVTREDKDLVVDYQIMLGDNVLSCSVEVVMLVGGPKGEKILLGADELKGDFGKISDSGFKSVRYNVEEKKTVLAGKDIRFTLNVKNIDVLDDEIVAIASMSVYPQLSYGLMLGYVKKFGGYVKFRSDFVSASPAYFCDRQGMTDGGIIWATGEQRKSRMLATGGALFRVAKWFYPYVGAGYGSRNVYWQDYEGQWAKVVDFSCKGIALEVGTIFKLGPVAISAGVSNTAFKFTEVEVGVGLMF